MKAHLNSEVSSTSFIARLIEKDGGTVKAVYPMVMTVPHMFDFHRKKKHEFTVNLYTLEGSAKALHG